MAKYTNLDGYSSPPIGGSRPRFLGRLLGLHVDIEAYLKDSLRERYRASTLLIPREGPLRGPWS